jgi:DNA-binding NtrC family response regulator
LNRVALEASIRSLLENPFSGGGWDAAAETLRHVDLGERIGILAGRAAPDLQAIERLILACGHARACADPDNPDGALGERLLPRALERRLPRHRSAYLRIVMAAARCRRVLLRLRGTSQAMQNVRRSVWAACFGQSLSHALALERVIHDHDVLVLGETGTGKEAVAIAILDGAPGPANGSRAPRGMLNVAAVPETLVESELFGHTRGAFTGATSERKGRIRSAAGGCLFIDEVGDLPLPVQAKLLRVMENDLVAPIGSDVEHEANVRYVAATHKPLDALAAEGSFRRDLYERLAGHIIRIPPLRERPEDILDIGMAIVEHDLGDDTLVDRRAIERWLTGPVARRHPWLGNVRELQNTLRDLMLGLDTGIAVPSPPSGATLAGVPDRIQSSRATLSEVRDWYTARVLAESGGNLARAARILGVDRTTLRRHLGNPNPAQRR